MKRMLPEVLKYRPAVQNKQSERIGRMYRY